MRKWRVNTYVHWLETWIQRMMPKVKSERLWKIRHIGPSGVSIICLLLELLTLLKCAQTSRIQDFKDTAVTSLDKTRVKLTQFSSSYRLQLLLLKSTTLKEMSTKLTTWLGIITGMVVASMEIALLILCMESRKLNSSKKEI